MSNTCKVVVLGSTGMAGYAIGKYFQDKAQYDVKLSLRNFKHVYAAHDQHFFFDVNSYLAGEIKPNIFKDCDYIINCIGGIKQHNLLAQQLTKLNVTFPRKLAEDAAALNVRLIHISTDCVFSGIDGNYVESDSPDASDDYGLSKLKGEPETCMVIRTSLIGEELHDNVSFLGWAKSKKNQSVFGYENHFWNGVTTQQFAAICDQIMSQQLYVVGTRHVFNPTPLSKASMLNVINQNLNLNLQIDVISTDQKVDRTLSTNYDLCNLLNVPSFEMMVKNLTSEK